MEVQMKAATRLLAISVSVLLVVSGSRLAGSGAIGLYGIVEKVVFEPAELAPERVQVWGAFAYADGAGEGYGPVSAARRGYLYFRLPDVTAGMTSMATIDTIRTEWADLKAVAGTGQAVAFGRWGYIAGFASLDPAARPTPPSVILHRVPQGGATSDLRVRPAMEAPASPAVYETNTGIVKLSDQGNHAAVVQALRAALKG